MMDVEEKVFNFSDEVHNAIQTKLLKLFPDEIRVYRIELSVDQNTFFSFCILCCSFEFESQHCEKNTTMRSTFLSFSINHFRKPV